MDFSISRSDKKRMGRPPKFRKPIIVRLDPGVAERINKILRSKEKRADFIRAAIDQKLVRREKPKLR